MWTLESGSECKNWPSWHLTALSRYIDSLADHQSAHHRRGTPVAVSGSLACSGHTVNHVLEAVPIFLETLSDPSSAIAGHEFQQLHRMISPAARAARGVGYGPQMISKCCQMLISGRNAEEAGPSRWPSILSHLALKQCPWHRRWCHLRR